MDEGNSPMIMESEVGKSQSLWASDRTLAMMLNMLMGSQDAKCVKETAISIRLFFLCLSCSWLCCSSDVANLLEILSDTKM